MEKYELIKEGKATFMGRVIYRIRALKDFGDVKAGDVGGWVCSYNNLSQEGECWIYDEAKCLDNAMIFDNAKMYDNSIMYDKAKMYHEAKMYDNAIMLNNSIMYDNSKMFNNSKMFGKSVMRDNAEMCGNATMYDSSIMYDNSKMFNNSKMYDEARMYDYAVMFNDSKMYDNSKMYNKARMFDYAILNENKILYGSINKSYKKIFQYHCEKRLITAILTEVNEILYSVGCQIGITKEEFIDRIYNDCEIKGKGLEEYPYRQEYLDIIDMAENYLRKFI